MVGGAAAERNRIAASKWARKGITASELNGVLTMTTSKTLLSPHLIGSLTLPNRIVMAPVTRFRAPQLSIAPISRTSEYYAQLASAGLIISEGIAVSAQARGYYDTPGLYTDEQEHAWRQVTDAVHRHGGRIFAQLWHCGRISHSGLHVNGTPPIGPDNIHANSKVRVFASQAGKTTLAPSLPPRALSFDEARAVKSEFVSAARRAIAAGFDGVEINAEAGYLFDQFRCPYLNHRSDEYGGSLENRCRLLLETAAAVAAAVGKNRTGVRLSPLGIANDMRFDPEPEITYGYLARELSSLQIIYLHLNEQDGEWMHNPLDPLLPCLRGAFTQTLILSGEFDEALAEATLQFGVGDLIAFGSPFISIPHLVKRLRQGTELALNDQKVFYSDGTAGYADYPTSLKSGGSSFRVGSRIGAPA